MSPELIYPGIHRITLPLPGKKPGPVNVYVFQGKDGVTLLDAGTWLSRKHLKADLGKIGLSFGDIDRIVLTHGHIDHYGAASAVVEKGNARVYAHEQDRQAIERGADAPLESYHRFLTLCGTPRHMLLGILPMFLWMRRLARPCPVDNTLKHGDSLMFGIYPGRIIETPGHTRGSICVYLEDKGLLFSGDHILGHITPNALPMLEKGRPLPRRLSQKEFYASLNIIEDVKPGLVHPAHGKPVRDFTAIHRVYTDSFNQRQQAILNTIQNHPGQSVYAMARAHFTHLDGTRFLLDLYLAVSEIYTHIQVLEDLGKVSTTLNKRLLTVESVP